MPVFFERGKAVKCEFDPELRAVIVTWRNMSNDEIVMECLQAQLEQVKAGGTIVIVDVSRSRGMMSAKVQRYFEQEFFAAAAAAGGRVVVTVTPKRELALSSTEKWTKTGEALSFTMYEAQTVEAARELVKQLRDAEG